MSEVLVSVKDGKVNGKPLGDHTLGALYQMLLDSNASSGQQEIASELAARSPLPRLQCLFTSKESTIAGLALGFVKNISSAVESLDFNVDYSEAVETLRAKVPPGIYKRITRASLLANDKTVDGVDEIPKDAYGEALRTLFALRENYPFDIDDLKKYVLDIGEPRVLPIIDELEQHYKKEENKMPVEKPETPPVQDALPTTGVSIWKKLQAGIRDGVSGAAKRNLAGAIAGASQGATSATNKLAARQLGILKLAEKHPLAQAVIVHALPTAASVLSNVLLPEGTLKSTVAAGLDIHVQNTASDLARRGTEYIAEVAAPVVMALASGQQIGVLPPDDDDLETQKEFLNSSPDPDDIEVVRAQVCEGASWRRGTESDAE